MLNKPVPDFEVPATSDQTIKLSDFLGKFLIIYFYPKDSTPGCTTQGLQFRDLYEEFQGLNVEILGVSRDTIKSHEKFKEKYTFPFELLSDTEETVCNIFDVIKLKNMYGKKVRGIERSTFVIDPEGKLIQEWRKVKADGHAQIVLDFVKSL